MGTTLVFFRPRPLVSSNSDAILSSMQAFESSFFLIALHRYPHALLTCASAIEYALQAGLGANTKDAIRALIAKARKKSQRIDGFSEQILNQFCDMRNKIAHRGFGSNDNSESTILYLEVGLLLAAAIYHDLCAFDLIDGLLREYAELLEVASRVCQQAKTVQVGDFSYCLNPFSHLVRRSFKENFSAAWEFNAILDSEQGLHKAVEMSKEKDRLEQIFDNPWTFDCPLCKECASIVCDL